MSEEEAKTKWCPFVRATTNNGTASWNRGSDAPLEASELITRSTRCIGSACMAWRPSSAAYARNIETGVISNVPVAYIDASKEEFVNIIVGGYCGLAGKP
jgi:hypothetical protein